MILKLIILLSLYIYVQNPKNGDVFFHYSTDEKKLYDWKSDGINQCNNGQKNDAWKVVNNSMAAKQNNVLVQLVNF